MLTKMIINYHWVSGRSKVISLEFPLIYNIFAMSRYYIYKTPLEHWETKAFMLLSWIRYQMNQIFVLSLHYLAANAWDNLQKEDRQHQ